MKRKITQQDDIKVKKIRLKTVTPVLLCKKNPHSRDRSIQFIEESHTYKVDWNNDGNFISHDIISVTSFCKSFFPKFNADTVISNMMKSKKWSKSKYFGMNREEIKETWEKQRCLASTAGTSHHLFCENFYNGVIDADMEKKINENRLEIQQFLDFTEDHKNLVPFRTEWILRTDEEHKICGTPDIVFINKETNSKTKDVLYLDIYDWKNSKKITKFGFEKGNNPLHGLPNSNYFHYGIQLNIYKYILEKFYSDVFYEGNTYSHIQVRNMFIIVMHKERQVYGKMLLPNYQEEVEKMFQIRKEQLNLKHACKDKKQPTYEDLIV